MGARQATDIPNQRAPPTLLLSVDGLLPTCGASVRAPVLLNLVTSNFPRLSRRPPGH